MGGEPKNNPANTKARQEVGTQSGQPPKLSLQPPTPAPPLDQRPRTPHDKDKNFWSRLTMAEGPDDALPVSPRTERLERTAFRSGMKNSAVKERNMGRSVDSDELFIACRPL